MLGFKNFKKLKAYLFIAIFLSACLPQATVVNTNTTTQKNKSGPRTIASVSDISAPCEDSSSVIVNLIIEDKNLIKLFESNYHLLNLQIFEREVDSEIKFDQAKKTLHFLTSDQVIKDLLDAGSLNFSFEFNYLNREDIIYSQTTTNAYEFKNISLLSMEKEKASCLSHSGQIIYFGKLISGESRVF